MHREYHRWFSPNLQRDMELLVFGHAGARTLVFPTRDGRFYDYENWGMVNALQQHLANGWLQLFCVESVDAESLYCDWRRPEDRIKRHLQYEAYLLGEVLPFMEGKNPVPFNIAHGCSLGAFHAVNIAFRHPQRFGKVVGLSGRYDLTVAAGGFRGLFDGHYDEDIYFNTPSHFVRGMTDPALIARLRHLQIVFAIGLDDVFLENNRQLSRTLVEKGIANDLHLWHGEAHRPRAWRHMVTMYL